MSNVYFHKNGRLAISYRNGIKVPFEPLGDARSVIVLDEEKNAEEVSQLREYVTRRIGGVSELKTVEEYESVKKNHPYKPELAFNRRPQTKLFTNVVVPKAPQASAPVAAGVASARPAAADAPAQDAMEQEGRRVPLPISRGRKIRTGRVSPEGAVTESPSTSNPAAGSGASATPETTEG